MSVYVLVHGGFVGGWVWSQVDKLLRPAGHEVFRSTLTGLGERVHLATPEVDFPISRISQEFWNARTCPG